MKFETFAKYLKHSVIPHPSNDHRPYLLRHGALSFYSASLITLKILTLVLFALSPSFAELATISSSEIISLTNLERQNLGQHPLKSNPQLSQAALLKAQDMLENDYFAHQSPDGKSPWHWLEKTGYQYASAGENLAIGFNEAKTAIAAWMASASHRDNILNSNFLETGVAAVTGDFQGNTTTVIVQFFASPKKQAPQETLQKILKPQVSSPQPLAAKPSPEIKILSPDPFGYIRSLNNTIIGYTSLANETVSLMEKGKKILETRADQNGNFSFILKGDLDLADGLHHFSFLVQEKDQHLTASITVPLHIDLEGPQIFADKVNIFSVFDPQNNTYYLEVPISGNVAKVTVAFGGKITELKKIKEGVFGGFISRNKNEAMERMDISIRVQEPDGHYSQEIISSALPAFMDNEEAKITPSYVTASQLNRLLRNLLAIFIITIIVLLLINVLVRIRVQKPGIILHTIAVLIVMTTLLLI